MVCTDVHGCVLHQCRHKKKCSIHRRVLQLVCSSCILMFGLQTNAYYCHLLDWSVYYTWTHARAQINITVSWPAGKRGRGKPSWIWKHPWALSVITFDPETVKLTATLGTSSLVVLQQVQSSTAVANRSPLPTLPQPSGLLLGVHPELLGVASIHLETSTVRALVFGVQKDIFENAHLNGRVSHCASSLI